MSKLKKEELLHYLEKVCSYCPHLKKPTSEGYCIEYQQAYEQIKEMIQKPEVTEEWIKEKARELHEMCSYADRTHGFMYTISIDSAKDFIRSLVESILHLKNKD